MEPIFINLIISSTNSLLLLFASAKFLLALQQVGYKGHLYFRWLYSKKNAYRSRLMLLSLLGYMFFMVLGMTFAPLIGDNLASYVGFIAYIFFMGVYIYTERHINAKIPLKITKRMLRLIVVYVLLLFGLMVGLIALLDWLNLVMRPLTGEIFSILKYSLIALLPMVAPFVLMLAYLICKPMENAINNKYVKKTKKVLAKSDVLKIGITGSYGKTSVKEILKTLLSVKYRVLATPESYNTPLGISLTVHKLDAAHDVFIAEMGARETGDIGNLAKLVNPDIAVLTGVNDQHLESFKSVENIKNTKYELFENLKAGGKAFFDGNSAISRELSERFTGEKYLIGDDEGIVKATDVKISSDGTSLKLVFDNGSEVDCFTTLIGKHSVRNILLAVAVAYKIGLTPNEISLGISRLHAVKHRLEILPNNKGITLIDDSYNANSDGAMSALETMALFDGRKIIVTPGLVELGANQNEINYKLGKEIASKCDKMIISAKHNAELLISGFIDGGGDRANISYANGAGSAKKLLSEVLTAGDVVLFENDLPDIYD